MKKYFEIKEGQETRGMLRGNYRILQVKTANADYCVCEEFIEEAPEDWDGCGELSLASAGLVCLTRDEICAISSEV